LIAGFVALNWLTIATAQPSDQVALCLTLSAIVIATHLARTAPEALPAIRSLDLRRLGIIK